MNNSTAAPAFKSPYPETSVIVSCIFYVIVAFLAVFGNALVVGSFIRHERLRTFTNYFVASLAVADVLVGLISIPMWMTALLYPMLFWDQTYMEVYRVFDTFSGTTSILHLMVISLERYYAVAFPVRHRNSNALIYYVSLVFVWVVPASFCGASVKIRTLYKDAYMLILFILFFVLPLLVILFAYRGIWKVVRNRIVPQGTQGSRSLKRDMRIIVTIALVIAFFVIAWLPFFVVNFLFIYCKACLRGPSPPIYSPHLILFIKFMHYSNSAVNPVVYAVKIPEFRRAFRQIVAVCLCCWNKVHPKDNNELFSGTDLRGQAS